MGPVRAYGAPTICAAHPRLLAFTGNVFAEGLLVPCPTMAARGILVGMGKAFWVFRVLGGQTRGLGVIIGQPRISR